MGTTGACDARTTGRVVLQKREHLCYCHKTSGCRQGFSLCCLSSLGLDMGLAPAQQRHVAGFSLPHLEQASEVEKTFFNEKLLVSAAESWDFNYPIAFL